MMHPRLMRFLKLALAAASFALLDVSAATRRFTPTTRALANPHTGWIFCSKPERFLKTEGLDGAKLDLFGVVSLMVGWNELEIRPGVYDWTALDGALDRVRALGKNAHLRLYLMPDQTPCWNIRGIPEWLETDFKVPVVEVGNRDKSHLLPTRHPHYWHPAFQERARRFLGDVAKRYDASRLDLVDARIYASHGEWDSGNNVFPWGDFPDQEKEKTLKDLVRIYIDAFRGSSVIPVFNVSAWKNEYYPEYLERVGLMDAVRAGFGLRYDAFQQWGIAPAARDAFSNHWMDRPLLGEPGRGWDTNGDSRAKMIGHMLGARLSMSTIGGIWGNVPEMQRLFGEEGRESARKLGYRFFLPKAEWQRGEGGEIKVTTWWTNEGVGALFRPYGLSFHLTNRQSGASRRLEDPGFDARKILPGELVRHESRIPSPGSGAWDISLSLASETTKRTLHIAVEEERDGMVPLGALER